MEQCADCGAQLSGGWTLRTQEMIDLPQVPVQVTEHACIARACSRCQRCCVPPAQLGGVVMDKQRLGINLVSLIAGLREEARLPLRAIQWYLDRAWVTPKPESTEAMGTGVDTRDDGQGEANGPGPIPTDGDVGSPRGRCCAKL